MHTQGLEDGKRRKQKYELLWDRQRGGSNHSVIPQQENLGLDHGADIVLGELEPLPPWYPAPQQVPISLGCSQLLFLLDDTPGSFYQMFPFFKFIFLYS